MSGFKTVSKRMFVLIAALALAGMMLPAFSQTKRRPKYTLPSETVLRVRMNDKLTSKTAQVGSHFQTTVVTPVYAKGVQVIPAGAIVMGKVTHVERASRKSNSGSLTVTFTSIKMPNGTTHPLSASLAASDSKDTEGEIKGNSSKKRNARFIGRGMVVGGLINGGTGVATGGLIGAARGLIKKGEEAQVDPGTEFDIMLDQGISLTAFP